MSEPEIQIPRALREGLEAHNTGQFDRAKALYLEVLQDEPDNAEALHLLSAVDGMQGRAKDGEKLCRRAIRINPERAAFHNTLGELLQAQERYREAEAAYRQALALQPDFAAAENNLGALILKRGDSEQAMGHFRRAVELDPNLAEAWNNLGRMHNNAGDYEAAEVALRRAVEHRPLYGQAHNNLGHVLRSVGRLDEAEACFRKAIELRPGLAIAHFNLGTILEMQGRPRLAAECFEASIARNRLYAPAYNHLGACYQLMDQPGKAVLAYRKATRLNPDDFDALNNLANALQLRGDIDESFETYLAILDRDPGNLPALSGLTALMERNGARNAGLEIVRASVDSGEAPVSLTVAYLYLLKNMNEIDAALATAYRTLKDGLSEMERADLQFAIGDLLDAQGKYDEAFEHYRVANTIKAQRYDPRGDAAFIEGLVEFFSSERMTRLPRATITTDEPVFIVGMPRSGTSLVEQILASHPAVCGAGELDDIGRVAREMPRILDANSPYPRCLRFIKPDDLDGLVRVYLNHIRKLRGDPDQPILRTTDKMPTNFLHLGLIEMLFPGARIIHCTRNPLDIGLSCYVHNFSGHALAFSYDLEHIGLFYKQYQKLMQHWKETLQIPILEVVYEELIADQEEMSRKMIEFIGLEWNEACLRFYETPRSVDTASRHQVSRPIYTTSVDRFQHYASHLDPLRRVLEKD